MASMLGLLEARETAARERAEDLREVAARAASALGKTATWFSGVP